MLCRKRTIVKLLERLVQVKVLFHIMLGLLTPSSGNVIFENENIHANIEN